MKTKTKATPSPNNSDQLLVQIEDALRAAMHEANVAAEKHERATGVLAPAYQYENGRRNMAQDIYRRVRGIVTGVTE